jgi:endonuclease-3 related protein
MLSLYKTLLKKYGKQNWWPTITREKENQKIEIAIGAILTQNTSWKNVEKALHNLNKKGLLSKDIINIPKEELASLIKPAGYYNQKAERIQNLIKFLIKNKNPTREELLKLKGVGKETADSILLYAYNKPYFIIDAYTKRLFSHLNFKTYDEWQSYFHKKLPRDIELYKEFHALIVEHMKNKKK